MPRTLQQAFASEAIVELCAPLQTREVRQLSLVLKTMADMKKKKEEAKKVGEG